MTETRFRKPPEEIFIYACCLGEHHPEADRFLVHPGRFHWDRKTVTNVTIVNTTDFVVELWFPDFQPDGITLEPHGKAALPASATSNLRSGTELEFQAYVPHRRRFAQGNSAPKMILDP